MITDEEEVIKDTRPKKSNGCGSSDVISWMAAQLRTLSRKDQDILEDREHKDA